MAESGAGGRPLRASAFDSFDRSLAVVSCGARGAPSPAGDGAAAGWGSRVTGVSSCTGKGFRATPGLIRNIQHHTGFPQQGSTPPGCFRLYSRHPGSKSERLSTNRAVLRVLPASPRHYRKGLAGTHALYVCEQVAEQQQGVRCALACSTALLLLLRQTPHQFETWHKLARAGLGVVRKPEPGEVVRLHELHLRRHGSIFSPLHRCLVGSAAPLMSLGLASQQAWGQLSASGTYTTLAEF